MPDASDAVAHGPSMREAHSLVDGPLARGFMPFELPHRINHRTLLVNLLEAHMLRDGSCPKDRLRAAGRARRWLTDKLGSQGSRVMLEAFSDPEGPCLGFPADVGENERYRMTHEVPRRQAVYVFIGLV